MLTTAAAQRFVTKSHGNLGSSWSHARQGYLSGQEMAFLLATQLVARGYDPATARWLTKQLPANQAAVARTALDELDRAWVVDALGFEAAPEPRASPRPATRSLWSRLFGG